MKHLGTKELETTRLKLRRFESKDAKEICEGYYNQEEFLYFANKTSRTVQEEKEAIARILERYKNESYYNWLIIQKETNAIIGSINLVYFDRNDSVEVNYAIDNRFTKNGYMTEALIAVKDFILNEIGLKRFQGGCCTENIASKRVMEKSGMKLEGTLQKYVKLKDGYHDMYMFSEIKNN